MNGSFNSVLYEMSIWALPVLIAITFHEASHGYVAYLLGDDTAWRLGRVSFNPLVHIDPFGTVVIPAILLLMHSPFLFGYAKPVPVNFRALRRLRLDTILVAAAGPGMNLLLATLAALAFHIAGYIPAPRRTVVGCEPKKRSLAQRRLSDFQSSTDPAPRWRTHPSGHASGRLGTSAVSCRTLWHADTDRSAFCAANAWS